MSKGILTFSLSLACALFSLLLVSCNSKNSSVQQSAQKAPPQKVQAFVVSKRSLQSAYSVGGYIVAGEEAELHSEISGRINEIHFTEGQRVKSGDLLVKLYDGDLQAQLRKLRVQLEIVASNEQRLKDLLAVNATSQVEYDNARLQRSTIEADIDIVRESIRKTEILAPFSGVVGLRNFSPGAYVTTSAVVVHISQNDGLKLDFSVPERNALQIRAGSSIRFTVSGVRDTFSAKVMATEQKLSDQSHTMKVRARINKSSPLLVSGASAEVLIAFQSTEAGIVVPTQAVIPQARLKKVALLREGRAQFQEIVTSYRDNNFVQIASGLSEGDTVAVSGLMALKPGTPVEISSFFQSP